MRIGLLHPGEMGAAVGGSLTASGHEVAWASEGRSQATVARADASGMHAVETFDELMATSAVVFSVCPPHAARRLADRATASGFRGLYVDANAVAPGTARSIGGALEAAGAVFVDGGIVGPAPLRAGSTRIYLSGPRAGEVAALFTAGDLEAVVVDDRPGSASAVKACYASRTKVSSALLLAVRGLAAAEGVEDTLLAEWDRSQVGVAARSEQAASTAAKAWRWVGEMEELGQAAAAAGLPDGFHAGAAELYQRLAVWRDQPPPTIGEVVSALLPPRD